MCCIAEDFLFPLVTTKNNTDYVACKGKLHQECWIILESFWGGQSKPMDHFSPFEEARENQPGQSENMGAQSTYTGWNFNFHLPNLSTARNYQYPTLWKFYKRLNHTDHNKNKHKLYINLYEEGCIKMNNSKAKANLHSLHGRQRQRQTYGF